MPERPPAELFDPPFEVVHPSVQTNPAVFNSPHSGRQYPREFLKLSQLDSHRLRRSEDCYVDDIFAGVVGLGAPLLKAHFPRAYLDVNREPYELDQGMFLDSLPAYVNSSSVRVAGGLGTIPRLVCDTAEIYRRPLYFAEAKARIQSLYMPYHRALEGLLDRTVADFGEVLLIDCHSMPSTATPASSQDPLPRPDFVLGDRYGSTCAPAITDFFEAALLRRGYSAVRNKPYAGGHITQIHGRPNEQRHALQIEINRALYMDEESLAVHGGFYRMTEDFQEITAALVRVLPDLFRPSRIAAE
ncbi:N-formylglutamate amidohydrolase [Rhodoligotrophos appendicifer]|uniref:N-formylglutamate amidohydrolase n=1 Tax=Rhodoligotrophos appendicifer TaxID=987056 RepID=UPI001186C694|nr:N-formylglutamate amidohydrolase [Rhodoligotrophos appendicifer]